MSFARGREPGPLASRPFLIPRIHAFELEDQAWLPATLRDGVTDYLQHNLRLTRVYDPVVPVLARLLAECGERDVIDLCSGAGGPW